MQGSDRTRVEIFSPGPVIKGDPPQSLWVVDRDRAWVKSRGQVTEMSPMGVASRRLDAAFDAASVNLAPLRDAASEVEPAGEEAVDGRPAVGLKVTRPDGTFTLYFDRESGLPVRGVRHLTIAGGRREAVVTVTFREYEDFGGLKAATRRVMTNTQDGGRRVTSAIDVTDFKVLDKVDPATFAKPE